MKNNIKELEIKNFKSIKRLKFKPKKVNVFIGKPNVGKSNILEAMSLMTGLYNTQFSDNFFNDEKILRYREIYNLFYDESVENEIEVITDKSKVLLDFYRNNFVYVSLDKKWLSVFNKTPLDSNIDNLLTFLNKVQAGHVFYSDRESKELIENNINRDKSYLKPYAKAYNKIGEPRTEYFNHYNNFINPIKRYSYKHFDNYTGLNSETLYYPFGENLFAVLNANKTLLNEVCGFLEEQGLELVLDKRENRFIIQKKVDRIVYQVNYSSIADTLRHIIFYITAIESNDDSVLLFEEPEVHSYPPYIKMLADRIALDEKNQYFLSTHSPYMLNTLINSLGNNKLNVILTYYENYQTKIKVLTAEEIDQIQEWKMDVFFNLDRFIDQL